MISRRVMMDDKIVSASGTSLILESVKGSKIPSFAIKGWTKQETTTGAQLFNKSTVTENKYISDTNGTEQDRPNKDTNASDYINVSGFDQIYVTKTNLSEWAAFYNSDKVFISGFNGYGKAIAVPEGANYVRFTVAKKSMDTFMVNAGSAAQPWEPYTGGKLSPSPDYPQEIASAGLYDNGKYKINLTIADGSGKQQNVLLTSDRPLTKWDRLEKRDGVWGWNFQSAKIMLTGNVNDEYAEWDGGFYLVGGIGMSKEEGDDLVLCKELIYSNLGEYPRFRITTTKDNKAPLIYNVGAADVTAFRQWLQAHPLTFVYKSLNETFVPLPESEQAALNALHTYTPTTVITNDQQCEMQITYREWRR